VKKKPKKLAFLDVETTGLNPDIGDRVCEVGIIVCDGFDVVEEYSQLVNPERPISPGAYAVNHINQKDLKTAPKFAEVADEVRRLLEDKITVCHNVPFDLNFIVKEFSLLGKAVSFNKFIDTLQIARRYFNFPSNSLQNIAGALDIKVARWHRALSDADITRKVLMNFMTELGKKNSYGLMNFVNNRMYENVYAEKEKRMLSNLPAILEDVILSGKKIYAKYISSTGKFSERVIEPREIVFQRNSMYLIGFCHLKQENRTFRLDRFLGVKILK
jgi:DNA polymerase-3 subunit epsilon